MSIIKNEIKIPIMITSDQPSERMARYEKHKLAETIKNGRGKFKIRTASGAFNSFNK